MKYYTSIFITILEFSNGLFSGAKYPDKYPYDPRIHNFGNVGIGGKIHANLARFITKQIDNAAYDGKDVRRIILENEKIEASSITDWCCGTGTSTDALYLNYKNSDILAYDSSIEMIKVARKETLSNAVFGVFDAEDITLIEPVDLITIMFAFHEIPQEGRLKIMDNAYRNLNQGGSLMVVDIDMDYEPSYFMRIGEPYIDDYQMNMQSDIRSVFSAVYENVQVPGHVRYWVAKK